MDQSKPHIYFQLYLDDFLKIPKGPLGNNPSIITHSVNMLIKRNEIVSHSSIKVSKILERDHPISDQEDLFQIIGRLVTRSK
eukprot:Gb_25930 [translate_table: standard]